MPTTTEQILASHEAALAEQNAFKVSAHYAKDAVAIINGTTYRGRREIASMYARLIDELPDAVWRTEVAVVNDDLAYVEWACESAASKVESGTDTFIVVDGFITRQTARFAVVANDGLATKQRDPAITS